MTALTYAEKLLLDRLADGALDDLDTTAERVLVGSGLARRVDLGKIEITVDGRKTLQD